jgi:CBS domain-containing protein
MHARHRAQRGAYDQVPSDFTKRNPFVSVPPRTTLAHCVRIFVQGDSAHHQVRRVYVVDASRAPEPEQIVGVVSQSNVINFLAVHKDVRVSVYWGEEEAHTRA